MSILPGFSSPKPPPIQPLPPPITREDPEIKAAKEKQRRSELQRKGRRSQILTGSDIESTFGDVSRPEAKATLG